jgi:hypothetical protein
VWCAGNCKIAKVSVFAIFLLYEVKPPLMTDINTWILHELEAFIGKASKGDVVVLYPVGA